jgi:hypothetical protein
VIARVLAAREARRKETDELGMARVEFSFLQRVSQ